MPRHDDTEIGGSAEAFPLTDWPAVRAAAGSDPTAAAELGRLLTRYWKPVYRLVRARWRKRNEEAKDLTQAFFAQLLDRQALSAIPLDQRSFRAWLRTALDRFLVDQERRAGAAKRGGGAAPLDVDLLASRLAGSDTAPDERLDRAARAARMAAGVRRLERELAAEGRIECWRAFQAYYLGGPEAPPDVALDAEAAGRTYPEVARQLSIAPHDVSNHLVYARRRLRQILEEGPARPPDP